MPPNPLFAHIWSANLNTDNDQSVEMTLCEVMSDRSDEVADTALAARKSVLKAAAGCSEFVGETYAVLNLFSFTGKHGQAFIHIATYANHVNLGFNHGAILEDPKGLLVGTGKMIRHVRLNSKSALRSQPIQDLIKNAVVHARELAEAKGGIQPARVGIRIGIKKKRK
jgi:hypothetical protein